MRAYQEFPTGPRRHPAIVLPDRTRVYAVGDVHGRLDLLSRMDSLIAKDMATSGAARNIVVFLGDYIDRGPQSAEVIESLRTERPDGIETVCLKGNHEDFMLAVMSGSPKARHWLMNGGAQTLESYGLDPWLLRNNLEGLGEALKLVLPPAHADFLESLPTSLTIGGVYFAHAGIDPERPLDDQDDHDLMWVREKFLSSDKDFGAVVVHGHTPRPQPEILENRINCDTGAYATNHLTAAVLETGMLRFLVT